MANAAPKTPAQTVLQIIVADVSMSLDNVLAVAGAARDHEVVLWIGLILSVVLMAVASNLIAPYPRPLSLGSLDRLRDCSYVAGEMIWDGSREVVDATGKA